MKRKGKDSLCQYAHFRKPRYCPNAARTGYSRPFVSEGDLINYRVASDSDGCRLARVLGLATHDGCGHKYGEPRLAVLATDAFLSFGMERHVELGDVLEVRSPGPFAVWFLFGRMPDIDTAYDASEYGSLSNDYVAPYLQGDTFRTDWRKVAKQQGKPNAVRGDYASAVAKASAELAGMFSYDSVAELFAK